MSTRWNPRDGRREKLFLSKEHVEGECCKRLSVLSEEEYGYTSGSPCGEDKKRSAITSILSENRKIPLFASRTCNVGRSVVRREICDREQ